MVCFAPLAGFRGRDGRVTSRRRSPTQAPASAPCGRCIGCRLDRARDWGVRISHEASLHDESSFVTLTYSDEALPDDYSVSVREMQLFLKRLRKAFEPARVRFYACGEYGEDGQRPHYHVILFGCGFADRVPWRTSASGHVLYRSPVLERVWPFGHAEIGCVTRESGAYVARYCLKKVTGAPAGDYYQRLHPLSGEVVFVKPEFAVMSTRPGIGYGWFKKYESDAFPSGFVVVDGVRYPVPRYYRSKLKGRYEFASSDAEALVDRDDLLEYRRKARAFGGSAEFVGNNTDARLAVREELQHLRQRRLSRD